MSDEKKNDGGPAHMQAELNPYGHYHFKNGNLSVRDHFAGLAMQGYWASQTEESCSLDWMQANPELESSQLRIVAELAYAQADAMIKARDK